MGPTSPRMTPVFFHLMLSLSEGRKHGYAMMQEVEARTAGRIGLGPGSLYYGLARLEAAGLIEETAGGSDAAAAGPHSERRRYYRLTSAGRRRLREEMSVLADIVAHARARRLIG